MKIKKNVKNNPTSQNVLSCKVTSPSFTSLVQQHHDAVPVGVAVEMSGDNRSVFPEDADQPLVVAFLNGGGVFDKRQVTHRNVSNDVNLQTKYYMNNYIKQLLINESQMFYLLLVLSSRLQSFLQPLKLSSWIRHVPGDFVRTVVKDCVQTNQP